MGVLALVTRAAPRRATRALALAAALVACGAGDTAAQRPDSIACGEALTARGVGGRPSRDPCFALANALVTDLAAKAFFPPRAVQSSAAGTAAPAGTPAQVSAAPTIQPTPLVSTNVATAAQDSGVSVFTAVSLNPVMLFSSTQDPAVVARLSRLLDLTFFFPVDGLDQDDDGALDYGGVRLRLNLTGPAQAREVGAQLTRIVRDELRMANVVAEVLRHAPDAGACATRLTDEATTQEAIASACGVGVDRAIDTAPYAELRAAAARAREQADARYLGLDLRFDAGDPSLGTVRNASATALQAGLGFGRRFDPSIDGADTGLRGRLGVRYVELRDTTLSDWQIDGGIAFEMSRLMDVQRLDLSAGFEFRYSGKEDDAEVLRTRYAEFRAGIFVPIAGAAGIAVSVSAPLTGDVSPVLSVSGNWQQLLAGLGGG